MGHTGHMMTHFGESRESHELVIMWCTCINVNDCQKRETLDLWQWTYFVYFYLCFDWRKFLNFLDWNKEQSATLEHDQNKNVLFRFKDLRGLEGNDRIVTNSRNNPKYRWKRWCLIEIPSRARVGFMPRRALSSENLERYFNQSRKVFYVLDYI